MVSYFIVLCSLVALWLKLKNKYMSMLRITQLELQQIGPFGDLTLEFPEKPIGMEDKAEIHILTGENGTGKSTVLKAISMLVSQEASNKEIFRLSGKKEPRLNLQLGTHRVQLPVRSKFDFQDQEVTLVTVPTSKIIEKTFLFPIKNYPKSSFGIAFFAYSGHRHFDHVSITGIKEIETNPLENVLDFRQAVNPENILQWVANNIAGSFIAQGRGDNQQAENFRWAVQKLEKAISEIIQKDIQFHLEYSPYGVAIKIDNEQLDFNQLPDGLKSIISWLSDLVMRMDRIKWENDTPVFDRNFILFLDEIEVHMHPAWQRKILPVVQKLFPNAQIFISTHSPFVVGSVDGAWIHKLVKPNGDSKLAEGYPILSEDEKSYEYWLEEVFGIHEKYGLVAQDKYERRRELIRKQELTPSEQDELKQLDEQFGTLLPEDSSLGQRIVEHLKKLKSEKAAS